MEKMNRTGVGRRLAKGVSFLLCVAMLLSMLAVGVSADDPAPTGSDTPAPAAANDGRDVSAENMYAIVTTTGAAAGDCVTYFSVRYTDEEDTIRSEFIFPTGGTVKESYDLLAAVSTPQERLDDLRNTFGYEPSRSFGEGKGLRQNATDIYFFHTYKKIKTVHSIDMFMTHDTEKGSRYEWTCNDIRLYKVNRLFGVEMTGYYSGSWFANFSGDLIAKFLATQWNSGDFSVTSSDKLFRIGMDENAVYDLTTDFSKEKTAVSYNASAVAKKLVFRYDLTDLYGAGIEALANLYKDNKAPLKDMELVESLSAIITYDDIYGASRKVTLPVILSSVGWAIESNPALADKAVIGIAQQGDTVLFEATLPDFAALTGYSLFFGQDSADKAGLRFSSGDNTRRQERLAALGKEDIFYAGLSIFDAEKAGAYATTEDAVLLMTTQGNPMYYYKTPNATGQKMSNNQQKNVYGDLKVPPAAQTGAFTFLSTNTGTTKYIFEIKTDEPETASTTDDIIMRLSYLSTDGNTKRTDRILLRTAVQDYYGFWPSKEDAEVAYLAGVSSGGKLIFALELDDVDYFTEVELTLVSEENAHTVMTGKDDDASKTSAAGRLDDWQLAGIRIYKVTSLSQRKATWLDGDLHMSGFTTDRNITREFDNTRVRQTFDQKFLLSQSSPTKTLTFSDTGDTEVQTGDVDWERIKTSMSYNETVQDLGFDRTRFTYTVNVTVQSNQVADEELGDCGSVNKFYFQLIFADGTSGYVQANQQLTGDGFRAGKTESFKISTNRNYGDVKAIRIIPDDTVDEENNIYDKLNVKEINVIQDSTSGLSCTWNFSPVGWIGIDYQDIGVRSTANGQKLRTELEISRNSLVSTKGYSLNLLFAMTTAEYTGEDPVYDGAIEGTIYYKDGNGIVCPASVDIGKAIAEYAERDPIMGSNANPGVAGKYVIDREYMLRENHIDRFTVALTNVKEILYMDIEVRGTVNTTWNLTDVSVYMINKDGPLIINSCDEYQHEAELTCICNTISEDGYHLKTNYDPEHNNSIPVIYPVVFTDYTIEVSTDDFTAEIERTPTGDDDSCNVFLYPKTGTDLGSLDKVSLGLKYQSREFDRPFQVSLSKMNIAPELGSLYYRGLSTKSMTKLNELIVESNRDVYFDHAIVQQVRSGVIVRTYYVPMDPALNAHISAVSGVPYKFEQLNEKQIVSLQFSEDTVETALVANLTDIAVGFTYNTTTDSSSITYQSAFVYLTDQQIAKICAGMRVDLSFDECCVDDIKEITIAAKDSVAATVTCATASTYKTNIDGDLEFDKEFSFSTPVMVTRNKQTINADDPTRSNVADLTLKVAYDLTKMSNLTPNDRVSLVIGYTDRAGDIEEMVIDDIEDYRVPSETVTNDGITLNVLVPHVMSLQYAMFEPHSSDPTVTAGLPLATVDASWTLQGVKKSIPQRVINRMIEEDEGYAVNLADVDLMCDISVMNGDKIEMTRSVRSRDFDATIEAPRYIHFEPEVTNSTAGYSISVEVLTEGWTYEMTQATHGYDFKPQKSGTAEPTQPVVGEEEVQYRITITSKELSNMKVTINLTYKNK